MNPSRKSLSFYFLAVVAIVAVIALSIPLWRTLGTSPDPQVTVEPEVAQTAVASAEAVPSSDPPIAAPPSTPKESVMKAPAAGTDAIKNLDLSSMPFRTDLNDCLDEDYTSKYRRLKAVPDQADGRCWITPDAAGVVKTATEITYTLDPNQFEYIDIDGDGYLDAYQKVKTGGVQGIWAPTIWLFNPEDPEHPYVGGICTLALPQFTGEPVEITCHGDAGRLGKVVIEKTEKGPVFVSRS